MDANSRFGQFFSRLGEKIADQTWYQQLKAKWDELDQQSRTYLRGATIVGSLLLVIFILFTGWWGVRSLRKEVSEKNDILTMLQSANEELRKLKETIPFGATTRAETGAVAWPSYFENTATTAGMDKTAISVSQEKQGSKSDLAKESMFDISLKHVNIKQIVRFSFTLENSPRPVKIRNISIDTKNDPEGYMDATLAVSGFTLTQNEGG
jgi:hypothetical protein